MAANWQLVFLVRTLQWDMINFWLPWRYFISECYNNGIIPMWDPYTQAGYPVHGDLQGPPFSPEAIVSSFLFGHNAYVLNYTFVFYLFLASCGMYKLCRYFKLNEQAALLAGITYSLCGYNTSHGHYLYVTISVALLPFLIYYFFRMMEEEGYLNSIKFVLLLYWQITTGNPSFLIVSGYFMLALFIGHCIRYYRMQQQQKIVPYLKRTGLAFILSVILAFPIIYNTLCIHPLTTRVHGLPLQYAGEEGFFFSNFTSFLTPLATIFSKDFFNKEQVLWSPYIGILSLYFFAIGLREKKSYYEKCLLLIALAALLLSFGLQTPVYKLAFRFLPLFNVFRMPNLMIIYPLLYMVLTTAKGISVVMKNNLILKSAGRFIGIMLFLYGAFLGLSYYNGLTGIDTKIVVGSGLKRLLYTLSPFYLILIQLGISVLILAAFWLAVKRKGILLLFFIVIADMLVNYQLGAICRNFGDVPAWELNRHIDRAAKGFPVPESIPVKKVAGLTQHWEGVWMNNSLFTKMIDYPNSNNFELSNYMKFLKSTPRLKDRVMTQAYAFFADSLIDETTYIDSLLEPKGAPVSVAKQVIQTAGTNRFLVSSEDAITCTRFIPRQVILETVNRQKAALMLTQNYTPLWKVKVNGKEVLPYLACGTFPLLLLEPGQNKIEFTYKLEYFSVLFMCSNGLLMLLLLYVIYTASLAAKYKRIIISGLVILSVYIVLKFKLFHIDKRVPDTGRKVQQLVEEKKLQGVPLLNNSTLNIRGIKRETKLNLLFPEDRIKMRHLLDTLHSDSMILFTYDKYFPEEAEILTQTIYGKEVMRKKTADGLLLIYTKTSAHPYEIITDSLLTFEKPEERNKIPLQFQWYDPDKNNHKLVAGVGHEYAYCIKNSCEWLHIRPGDVIVAEVSATSENWDDLALCISFIRNKTTIHYYAAPPSRKAIGWSETAYGHLFRVPDDIQNKDEFGLYIWNRGRLHALIDNLRLTVIRKK